MHRGYIALNKRQWEDKGHTHFFFFFLVHQHTIHHPSPNIFNPLLGEPVFA